MKISKVNHTMTAVGKESEQINGMLYRYPNASELQKKSLQKHVQEVNKKAQNLYNIFVPVKKLRKAQKDLYKSLTRDFQSFIKRTVLEKWNINKETEVLLEEQLKAIQNYEVLNHYDFGQADAEIVTKDFISLSLRSSLKKEIKIAEKEKVYVPYVFAKLLYAFSQGENYKKELSNIPTEHLKALITLINEDYGKANQINNIVKSIENQSVKVQYNPQTNKLELANAQHKKKKWIFAFIKEYAGATEEARKQLLRHMRALILLFYCGEERYISAKDNGVVEWSFETLQEDVSVDFADVIGLINQKECVGNDKSKKKELTEKIKVVLRNAIMQRYCEAIAVAGITESDKFWLEHFENCAEKILLSKNDLGPHKISTAYLCNQTWKEWTSFIAMKYVDMGKAVYHFATPNYADIKKEKDVVFGEVLSEFKTGITSFDYERIKADETVEREISRYITFAVNNFATAVMKEEERRKKRNEDVLDPKLNMDILKDHLDKRILQYFGGKSTWKDMDLDPNELFLGVQKDLYYIRNNHFHYATGGDETQKERSSIIEEMFSKEYLELGMKYRKKYYSNNVPKFYTVEDITKLMDRLYDAPAVRPAQIPSFNKILSRNTFKKEMENLVNGKPLGKVRKTPEMAEEFRSALYFVLKEIYYYDFLQRKDIKERFIKALQDIQETETDKAKQKAMGNFMERIHEIDGESVSFGEICQQMMTDYEQQNQIKGKKASGYEQTRLDRNNKITIKLVKAENNEEIYKHFKMLLYVGLKNAFFAYLKTEQKEGTEEKVFEFLRKPINREQEFKVLSEESFCADWEAHTYDNVQDDTETLAWFVMAHFLNPKQLNHLMGSIKNYLQYIENIDKRSASVGNRVDKNTNDKILYYDKILTMLEFCMPFCGQISNELTDYYEDADDYANHLEKYVNFTNKKLKGEVALREFCKKTVKVDKQEVRYGIYFDGAQPIMNRNVVMAMLYGAESVLANSVTAITEKDLNRYYKSKGELSELFKTGVCKTELDYQQLREFQNLKNRVELVDIMVFSELLSDLIGQLVGWAYLRERDLMYMQLGFHYVKLFHTQSVEENSYYRKMYGSDISIKNGAILYQIIAMYSYHLPVFLLDEKKEAHLPEGKKVSIGGSIGSFIKIYGEALYFEGLCFFEDINMHRYISDFRNYIDHFKYYATTDKSILDMYSMMFDCFFDYDLKLRKSVSFILNNILMSYFVVPKLSFDKSGEKKYKSDITEEKVVKKAAKITLEKVTSDIFTFNIPKEKEKNNPSKKNDTINEENVSKKKNNADKKEIALAHARSMEFLKQVMAILEFSKKN